VTNLLTKKQNDQMIALMTQKASAMRGHGVITPWSMAVMYGLTTLLSLLKDPESELHVRRSRGKN
jgi:hypothetical protein